MAEITKIYAVKNNEDKFVTYLKYPMCNFSADGSKAQTFPTYSKANTFAKKVNKLFGYKRVKVTTINL